MHENRALANLFTEECLKEKWSGHFSNIENSYKVVKGLVQIAPLQTCPPTWISSSLFFGNAEEEQISLW